MSSTLDRLWYEVRQYRRGLPTVASFDITERCQYHCKMCRFWIDGDHDESRELKTDQICSLIDELVDDLGVRRIRLLGGEPFLRPDVMDIVRHAKSRGIHVNVVSEGSLIDETVAEEIVESGLDSIRFSVDGLGQTHDIVRGKPGAFAQVARAIRSVQDAKVRLGSKTPEVQVFAVVSSLNYDQILPLYEACRSETQPGSESAAESGVESAAESETQSGRKPGAQSDRSPIRFLFGPVWEATADEVVSSVWRGKQLADRHHLPIGKSLQLNAAQHEELERQAECIRASQDTSRLTRVLVGLIGRLGRLASPILNREHCPETNAFHVDPFGRIKLCSVYMNYAYGTYPESSVRKIWFSRMHRDFHRDPRAGRLSPALQGSVRPRERLLRRHAAAASAQPAASGGAVAATGSEHGGAWVPGGTGGPRHRSGTAGEGARPWVGAKRETATLDSAPPGNSGDGNERSGDGDAGEDDAGAVNHH
ncbi:MAG: radical SAM protein [Candidatus Eisenbacteria bacterium]|nr:radical SAM protein [Candidatus Eisenbacteria bacterium]